MAGGKKRLVVGFDGFVDTIVRPIRQLATAEAPAEHYPDIPSLGAALMEQAGKSCSIELDVQTKKIGGNAPLLGSGAARLGMDVTVIGMLGEDGPEAIFREGLEATLYSYAPPGESIALEFSDGKVFLAPGVKLPAPAWQLVQQATGGKAAALLCQADALAILNWSEISFATALWQAAYEQALQPAAADKSRTVLFDLCDCSRKSAGEITDILRLIGRYSQRRRTLLSLNENEAEILARRALEAPQQAPGDTAAALRGAYGIDAVLVHTRSGNFYATQRGLFTLANEVLAKPRISTGAGDHYNAALCYACAHGMAEDETLRFATGFVHRYLSTGRAPTREELG